MKTIYDKTSDSIYIYLSESSNKGITETYCCDPLRIKQEFINFDISEDGKVIGIEVIKGSSLGKFLKEYGKIEILYNEYSNELSLIFNSSLTSEVYINDNLNYDNNDIFFGNIEIGFSDTLICYIKFKTVDKIIDLSNFKILNTYIEK